MGTINYQSTRVTGPSTTTVGASAVQVAALNQTRKELLIQNTGTTIIYLQLGTGTPTASTYTVALAAGTAANNGTGGYFNTDSWAGPVQAIGSAAGGTVNVTEIT